MKSRDETIAALADEILFGCTPGLVALATVLDSVLDEPLISNEDAAILLFGDPGPAMDAQERCERAARAVVVSYLQSMARGEALVEARLERDRDEALEELAALGRTA